VTKGRRRLAGWSIGVLTAAVLGSLAWFRYGPFDESLLKSQPSITVVDRHGEVLYESLSGSGTRGNAIDANHLPPLVVDATLTAEDRRFFQHAGISVRGVARALVANVRAGRVVEGGSTITQQVAKLLLHSRDRSVRTKVREAVIAMRLESRLTKNEILALYLNIAPYGNRIEGIGRASRAYFGVAPAQLTPAQAAFLAALPRRPSGFNPLRDPELARRRQRYVLAQMNLNAEQRKQALAERLVFHRRAQPVLAMHFVERVLEAQRLGGAKAQRIVTSIDAGLQREVLGIIAAQRVTLLKHGASSVAVAVRDNASGEWLAWEGSGDYFGDGFGGAIDGVTSPRQPGSTLKPFTYALAFESGQSPATVLADVPSHFSTAEEGIVYTPRNYDNHYRGPLRARMALAGSQNVPAVAMLSKFGPESLLRLLHNAGFTGLNRTADYYGLGLTLGDAEVTLEQLVTAYSMFARGGKPLFSQRTAFWITDILSDANAREYAFGSGGSLDFPFPVAVKTGTSQAYRDNWTIGYTRDVTVGVWVGNFDRRPLRGSSGITGAAPIFNAVMLAAVKRARGALPIGETTPIVPPPPNVEQIDICLLSGARPSPYCPAVAKEWLAEEESPRFCSWHHDGSIDWPGEYRVWAAKHAPSAPPVQRTAHRSVFRIANPPNGATYLIDPTLRMQYQTVRLRADATTRVEWRVNDRRIAGNEWALVPGRHTITAVDGRGQKDSVQILVK
jgi:penicillin-binding protein 1C